MSMQSLTPYLLARDALKEHTREVVGPGVNAFIESLYRTMGDTRPVNDDGNPWCAVFANAMNVRGGCTHSPRWRAAQALLGVGDPLPAPKEGCMAILERIDPKEPTVTHGHVTFFVEWIPGRPGWFHGLGGNQHNEVCIAEYDSARVLGWRMPVKVLAT